MFFAAVACAASIAGTLFTHHLPEHAPKSPLADGVSIAAYVFDPAVLIASFARSDLWLSMRFGAALAISVLGAWWVFASNDSSTSALVFMYGWIVGIPLAMLFVAVARLASDRVQAAPASI